MRIMCSDKVLIINTVIGILYNFHAIKSFLQPLLNTKKKKRKITFDPQSIIYYLTLRSSCFQIHP